MPIIVNGVELTDDAIFAEMQHHPAPTKEDAHMAAAEALVIRELLKQKAADVNLLEGESEADIDSAIFALIEQAVTAPEASTEICERYYNQNQEKFRAVGAPDVILPFDQVHEKIRDYLHTQSIREGVRAYIYTLAGEAKIAGFDFAKTA